MKTNIFLCVTEYHVLLSILLSVEKFCSGEYKNIIILCNMGRFSNLESYNFSDSGNIKFEMYEKDAFISHSFVQKILNECTGSLFVYNLNNPHFLYLFYKLSKTKKAYTNIVQEGLAAYNYIKYSFRGRINRIIDVFSMLQKVGIHDLPFYLYCYGHKGKFGGIFDYYDKCVSSSLVDHFWLSFPEDAKYGKNKVCKLPNFTSNSLIRANIFFRYQHSLILNAKDIVFVDQGIKGSFEFINKLSQLLPMSKIYIKMHPRINKDYPLYSGNNPNVIVLKEMRLIPVELLLQNLKGVIVISPFSSALLLDNPSCKYYYVYKWFINNGFYFRRNEIQIPGHHIQVVENVEDFVSD